MYLFGKQIALASYALRLFFVTRSEYKAEGHFSFANMFFPLGQFEVFGFKLSPQVVFTDLPCCRCFSLIIAPWFTDFCQLITF